MAKKISVGISVGDIHGIGPEIIIKSLNHKDILKEITPVIYGSKQLINFYKKNLSLDSFDFVAMDDKSKIKENAVNVINVWKDKIEIQPGSPTKLSGNKAFLSLQAAVDGLASGHVDVLVTAPIDKKNIQSKDFKFPGHTEYLANMSNVDEALMFLVSENLKVGVLTGHIPLKDVAQSVTKKAIVEKVAQMARSLRNDFGFSRPKIAVLGLNPHAGDNGLIGKEDQEVILPAMEELRANGILAFGPYAADGLFGSSAYQKFDGILAMYHDQGLIPFKAIAFDTGVNFTAGLPIVRTPPDHGTAFDIAGKNVASPESFRNAIYMACDIFRTRKEEKKIQENPLAVKKGKKERY